METPGRPHCVHVQLQTPSGLITHAEAEPRLKYRSGEQSHAGPNNRRAELGLLLRDECSILENSKTKLCSQIWKPPQRPVQEAPLPDSSLGGFLSTARSGQRHSGRAVGSADPGTAALAPCKLCMALHWPPPPGSRVSGQCGADCVPQRQNCHCTRSHPRVLEEHST